MHSEFCRASSITALFHPEVYNKVEKPEKICTVPLLLQMSMLHDPMQRSGLCRTDFESCEDLRVRFQINVLHDVIIAHDFEKND